MSNEYRPTNNIRRKMIQAECRLKADEIITMLSTKVPNFNVLKELDRYIYLKMLLELALQHSFISNFILQDELLQVAEEELPILTFIQIISKRREQ